MRVVVSASRPSPSTGSLAGFAVFEADTPLITHRPAGLPAADAAALAMRGTAEVKQDETGWGPIALTDWVSGGDQFDP